MSARGGFSGRHRRSRTGRPRAWRVAVAGSVVLTGLALVGLIVSYVPRPGEGPTFLEAYWNWGAVLVGSALFAAFLLGFARPSRPAEWRSLGLLMAFAVSLFAEMFGLPLTIFFVASWLDVPYWAFGIQESHLLAYALDRLGLLPLHIAVYLVMVVSVTLLAAGAGLVAVGWEQVYRQRDRLATTGLYGRLRHPQYVGFILIVLAFDIQWPTIPTLLMSPILITTYVRQARREDAELAARFGRDFERYAERVSPFGLRVAR